MKVCCFTGHRYIDQSELPELKQRLTATIENLVMQGVVFYGCGGAIGFDMMAGFATLQLKAKYPAVRLVMVLPCRDQDMKWPLSEKDNYKRLLISADKVVYVSEEYFNGCMKKRNAHLVENSDFCIAYLRYAGSGTAQTVRMARDRGLTVFNLAD